MQRKRTTIYDLAKELGVSPSYVSRALNDHPAINPRVRERVKKKAVELNYKHNLRAANLRQGSSSRTIGLIVPHIAHSIHARAISEIEEGCARNNHVLLICQSHDSYAKECEAVDMLIEQNVDCILITVSSETNTFTHLDQARKNNVELIQFGNCIDQFSGLKVKTDDKETCYRVVKTLAKQGCEKIAFLGGPTQITKFRNRKEGYIRAIKELGFTIPYNFIVDDALTPDKVIETVQELLSLKEPPDAFICSTDQHSLIVSKTAQSLGFRIPEQLGIIGFDNEAYTSFANPALSSVDQKSGETAKRALGFYFDNILNGAGNSSTDHAVIIPGEIVERASSNKQTS